LLSRLTRLLGHAAAAQLATASDHSHDTPKMPPNEGCRAPWLVTSPEYTKFVIIREQAGWIQRKNLPKAGAKEAKDSGLDAFIAGGLNGSNKSFSRAQVNAKFVHWKQSFVSKQTIQQVDEQEISSTECLCNSIYKLDIYTIAAVENITKQSTFQSIILSNAGKSALSLLCKRTIEAMNKALERHADNKKENYFKLQI
jgi:hypothetical protein